MLLKPFNELLKQSKPPEEREYLGYVENNLDPEKLGRLQIRCEPWMDVDSEDLPWCCNTLSASMVIAHHQLPSMFPK